MNRVEFFFDLSSPWTYLAFTNVQGVVARTGAHITYRPILAGGVFNAVNQAVYAARENADNRRFTHSFKVLKDWSAMAGLTMQFPNAFHPAKSVNAMRMACALEEDQAALQTFAKAAFESFFLRAENLDDPEVLVTVANAAGLDGTAIRAASITDDVKAKLRTNTDELISRGGYGSPTLFVNGGDMYFGNDQLPLVEAALKRNEA
ncbi:MAG: 2-hydroxychromene-2-carboxylate isomerase [Chakrabartia sp.]